MSRIDRRLEEVRASGRRALVAYVMAGYPAMEDTPAVVRGLVRGGADIVEIGHPFSDPMADGPVIQRAATASLEGGTTVATTLEAVRRIRAESDVPMVLMTYTNILYRYGYDRFMADAADAGIDGYILPDMSIEESGVYLDAARRQGASAIFLVSPNTEGTRIRRIAAASSGFLYMVAVYGTTGSSQGVRDYSVRAIRRGKGDHGGRDSARRGVWHLVPGGHQEVRGSRSRCRHSRQRHTEADRGDAKGGSRRGGRRIRGQPQGAARGSAVAAIRRQGGCTGRH